MTAGGGGSSGASPAPAGWAEIPEGGLAEGGAVVRVRWDKGGEAILTSMDADVLRLRSQVAYPPGARILGDALARPPYRLKMKIHSSRREADGLFAIEARAVDWTRPMREWVAEALAAGAPGRAAK